MIERDEDTFKYLKEMAEDIHLLSRNYNDELIGIDYYKNLSVLSDKELEELDQLWHLKCVTCYKEKLASQWMVVQVCLVIAGAIYLAWLSGGGIPGAISSIVGLIAIVAMIEDKRVRIAKRNLKDAHLVYEHLANYAKTRQKE
jgi:hypothetical protein